MTNNEATHKDRTPDDLRRRARERIHSNPTEIQTMTPEEIQALVNELQLHQAELEIINEDLLETQKRLERANDDYAVRASEERYRLLYDESPTVNTLISLDGTILDLNKRGLKSLGYQKEEVIGQPLSNFVIPEQRQFLADQLSAGARGETLPEMELSVYAKDGSVHQFLAVPGKATLIYGDTQYGYVCFALEITERKRTEERLRFAQISAGVGSWDWHIPTGKLNWSDELFSLFGIHSADGKATFDTWRNALHPDDRDIAEWRIDEAVKNHTTLDSDYRVVLPGGKIRWIRSVGRTQYEGGAPIRMSGICIDITVRKQTVDELVRVRTMLTEAQKIAHLGSFEYVTATRTTVWSEEEYRIYGLDPAQPSPEYDVLLAKCIHPDDAALLNDSFTKAIQNHSVFELEHRIVWPDGDVRWIHDIAHPYFNDNGDLVRYIGATLDITDRKRYEEEQTRALHRFELLAVTAGEILQIREPQTLVENLCQKVMTHLDCHVFLNFLFDEKTGRLHLNACAGISQQEAERDEWLDYDATVSGCVARDGKRIVAEHVQQTPDPRTELIKSFGIKAYACHPMIGPGDKVIGTLSFGTISRETFSEDDLALMKAVTDQVAIAMTRISYERDLRVGHQDMAWAQSVGDMGSWRLDVERDILTWSEQNYRTFGIAAGTVLTFQTFLSCVYPDDRPFVESAWNAALQGEPYDIEHRITAGGKVKWVREKAYLEFDSDGTLTGGFGITQDITRRKEYEEELLQYKQNLEKLVEERTADLRSSQEQLLHVQKMEALGQIAGGIAHDFNNMMQVVIGYALRTLRQIDYQNPIRDNLHRIEQAANSASALTHRLLAFSSRQILQPQVLLLTDLVLKVQSMLQHTLGEDVELICKLHERTGRVKADPGQIEQVLMNMAVNARHAMPNGGTLVMQTADVTLNVANPLFKDTIPAGEYVMVSISDTGCGMTKEIMERIFEPFFTTRPFGKGSGLGLSTAYGTIRQSGGVIRVYSEPGIGTTFKIYLPRTEEPIQITKSKIPETHDTGKGKTILVVEDNQMALELAILELRDLGYMVLQARNGDEAFAASRSHEGPIHLLLTDIVLPGANGPEIAATLSTERPEMVTLFMSGYDMDRMMNQGKITAGARVLAKPFKPDQLARSISDALKSRPPEKKAGKRLSLPLINTESSVSKRVLVVDDARRTLKAPHRGS